MVSINLVNFIYKMGSKVVFTDKDNEGQEMELYINDKGKLFIDVGSGNKVEYNGFIHLTMRMLMS